MSVEEDISILRGWDRRAICIKVESWKGGFKAVGEDLYLEKIGAVGWDLHCGGYRLGGRIILAGGVNVFVFF